MIEVRRSPLHDRGIFATCTIPKGKLIFLDPVVPIGEDEKNVLIGLPVVGQYYWNWTPGVWCLVLGKSSLLNHSTTPNVGITRYKRERLIGFDAVIEIPKDTELTIDYRRA